MSAKSRAVLRAARRLRLPGVKGVFIWCGHRYYEWSYEAQEAHLTKRNVFQAAKRECQPFIRRPSTHLVESRCGAVV